MYTHSLSLVLAASLLATAGGCDRKTAPAGTGEVPVIPVRKPVKRMVTDFVDFTGRLDAVQSVDIRARVTGYLVRMPFKEGSEVRGDDRLRGGVRVMGLLAAPLGEGPLLSRRAPRFAANWMGETSWSRSIRGRTRPSSTRRSAR